MNLFQVFIPYFLGVIGVVLWLLLIFQFFREKYLLVVAVSLPLYILLFLILVGLTPSNWLRVAPTEDQNADIAVVFAFGYEMDGDRIKPGEANQYLWEWIVNNKPLQLRTILVQEGVWVAAENKTLENLDIKMLRIHRHDPRIYVDTLNAAFCSIEQTQKLGKKKIMLIAHDLQLQRVVWDFKRVGHITCPDCIFVIPEIGDVPYPANSVHIQTRNEFIYKVAELLIARPRDFLNWIPTNCIAPIDPD